MIIVQGLAWVVVLPFRIIFWTIKGFVVPIIRLALGVLLALLLLTAGAYYLIGDSIGSW